MQSSKLVDEFTRAVRRRQSLRDWAKALLGAALIFLLVYLWSLIYGSPAAGAAERPQRQTFSGIGTVDRYSDGHAQVKFQGLTAQVYPAFAISPSTGTPAFSPRYIPAADEIHFVSDTQADGGIVLKKIVSLGRRTISSLLPNDATSVPQILSSARFTLSGIDPSNGIAAQAVGESTFSIYGVTESFFCWAIQVNDDMKLERPTAGWDVLELKQHGFYWYNGAGAFYVCFDWLGPAQICTWFDPAFVSALPNLLIAKTLLFNATNQIKDTFINQADPTLNYNSNTAVQIRGNNAGSNQRGGWQFTSVNSSTTAMNYNALFWMVKNASLQVNRSGTTGTQNIYWYKGAANWNSSVVTYNAPFSLGAFQFASTPTSGTNTISASAFTTLMDDQFRGAYPWGYGLIGVSSNEGGAVDAYTIYSSADHTTLGLRPSLGIQVFPRNPSTSIVRAGLRTATQAIINVTGVDSMFQYRLNRGSISVLSASLTATAKADGSYDVLLNIPADYDYMVQVGEGSVWCAPITLHPAGGATDISSLPTLAQLNTEISGVSDVVHNKLDQYFITWNPVNANTLLDTTQTIIITGRSAYPSKANFAVTVNRGNSTAPVAPPIYGYNTYQASGISYSTVADTILSASIERHFLTFPMGPYQDRGVYSIISESKRGSDLFTSRLGSITHGPTAEIDTGALALQATLTAGVAGINSNVTRSALMNGEWAASIISTATRNRVKTGFIGNPYDTFIPINVPILVMKKKIDNAGAITYKIHMIDYQNNSTIEAAIIEDTTSTGTFANAISVYGLAGYVNLVTPVFRQ